MYKIEPKFDIFDRIMMPVISIASMLAVFYAAALVWTGQNADHMFLCAAFGYAIVAHFRSRTILMAIEKANGDRS